MCGTRNEVPPRHETVGYHRAAIGLSALAWQSSAYASPLMFRQWAVRRVWRKANALRVGRSA